jgi:hypothetical protein
MEVWVSEKSEAGSVDKNGTSLVTLQRSVQEGH